MRQIRLKLPFLLTRHHSVWHHVCAHVSVWEKALCWFILLWWTNIKSFLPWKLAYNTRVYLISTCWFIRRPVSCSFILALSDSRHHQLCFEFKGPETPMFGPSFSVCGSNRCGLSCTVAASLPCWRLFGRLCTYNQRSSSKKKGNTEWARRCRIHDLTSITVLMSFTTFFIRRVLWSKTASLS